jgi:hypothetical protein
MFSKTEPPTELAAHLEKAIKDIPEASLFVQYKGIHLGQYTQLLVTARQDFYIKIPRNADWIGLMNHIFLLHPCLTRPVRADIDRINWNTRQALLTNFALADHTWQARASERVQPCTPVQMHLVCGKTTVEVKLADISMLGAGLLIPEKVVQQINLDPGTVLSLYTGMLFPPHSPHIQAKVVRLSHRPTAHFTSLGLVFSPTSAQSSRLHSYIASRHAEILQELERSFSSQFEPQQTKDLYF